MPAYDPDEYEQKRNQILDGALDAFAEKGFENATNKDIAKAAGIGSPGLIYHYFTDKADLFRRMMERHVPMLVLINHPEEIMDKPPREVLMLFGRTMVGLLENRRLAAAFRVILGEAVRRPQIAEMINKIGPSRGIALLSAYLQKQMDAGLIRRMEPGIAVRCFVGPLIAYVLTREFIPQPDSASISIDTMVENAVEVFLQGMEVR
jgi:TetR/AcrR family transcriptional regulator, mexJK operon transcriptional repressor